MIRQTLLALSVVTLLSACEAFMKPATTSTASAEETNNARKILIGHWLGEKKHDNGQLQKWLVHRRADGIYRIDFRTTETDGTIDQWSEVGIWGVRLPIYFTAMRGRVDGEKVEPANGAIAAYYDAYRVLELSDDAFTYNSYASGNTFTVRRVSADYKLDGQPALSSEIAASPGSGKAAALKL